jgi:hypothetical protein
MNKSWNIHHNCTFPFPFIHGWYICMLVFNNDVEIFYAAIFRGRNLCPAARRIKEYNWKLLYLKPFSCRYRPTLFIATWIKEKYSPRKNYILTTWEPELFINETYVNLQIYCNKLFVRPAWKLVKSYKRLYRTGPSMAQWLDSVKQKHSLLLLVL